MTKKHIFSILIEEPEKQGEETQAHFNIEGSPTVIAQALYAFAEVDAVAEKIVKEILLNYENGFKTDINRVVYDNKDQVSQREN